MTRLTLTCQAILFDLDGVLVDSRAVVERTWQRWGERHGLATVDIISRAHGRRSIETVREVAPHLDAPSEARWLETVEVNDVDGLVALPGAVNLYHALSDSRRAVVTSGGRALASRRLRAVGLALPSVLITAEDVQNGKPAPDGYLLAAARLAVTPRECVVIEDTPPGIDAGRAAEMTVLAVSTTFDLMALTAANASVRSLASVRVSSGTGVIHLEIVD